MAVRWKDFRGYTEQQLAKLTPEQRHIVSQAVVGKPSEVGGVWDEWYYQRYNRAVGVLSVQLGIDPGKARGLLTMTINGHRVPEQELTDESRGWVMEQPELLKRESYESDEAYRDAILNWHGQESLTDQSDAAAAEAAAAADAEARESTVGKLKAFAKEMLGDVDPNDPVMKGLVAAGVDAAQASAGTAGVDARSGLAGTQAASLGQANAMPYLAQRKSLGLGALSTAGNMELGLAQLQTTEAQYMQDRQDMMNAEAWKGRQNAAQGVWGTVGAVGGGILGAYFGGPQGAAMGAQAGAAGGSSLANLGQPSAPSYTTYKPVNQKNKPSGGGTGF